MDNLEKILRNSHSIYDIENIDQNVAQYIIQIGQCCFEKKALYTVLVTLLYYKYLHPNQDIRYHQAKLENGFSGRSFDTRHVTPFLRKAGFPSMAESGWLTRSLEQPYPYTLDYNGRIGKLKFPFLKILEYVQNNPNMAYDMLRILLHTVEKVSKENKISITPLTNPENLTIEKIILALKEHFLTRYNTHGAAKLPVIALYSIYQLIITEIDRYKDCKLPPISSLTACDKTNKASGDIEVWCNNKVFESIEIKLDKKISSQIIRVVENKIYKWNPHRYYILSVLGIEEKDKEEILEIVNNVLRNHGCQIIINGLIPTINYYLRLISDLNKFIKIYSSEVEKDMELQKVHKEKWNELITKYGL